MSDDSQSTTSRRKVINLMGGSLAAAPMLLSANAAAQAQQQAPNGMRRPGIEDPRNKYPKPPFAEQKQPWPGLAGNMNPRPITVKPATSDRAGWQDARH
jgi:hypothetical protein